MPGSEIPDLQGVFRFVSRLHTMSKRGMRGALADCPRCHFGMLENLHILIEQRGVEGAIYVSEVARAMRQPMPAVSRGLRMMEQDGSIVRETDPNDRILRRNPHDALKHLTFGRRAHNAYIVKHVI